MKQQKQTLASSHSHLKKTLLATALLSSTQSPALMANSVGAIMEEVTITARKKSAAENVQDVPIAISAFSDEKIEATHAVTLTDIGVSTPNANLAPIGTIPGVANFVIRGMGTVGASIPSQDPAVGVVVDGMAYGTIYGVVTDLFDLESIEVLRGPQGTLFGRNVTGGALNLRTKRPTDEFEAKIRAGLGNYETRELSALVRGPLTESVNGKISVLYKEHGGYWDNLTLNRKHGEAESTVVRPAISYNSEGFDISLLTEFGSMEGDGAGVRTYWADGEQLFNPYADNFTQQNKTESSDLDWYNVIVEANWDLWDGTLTAVLGYRDLEQSFGSDLDGYTTDRFRWAQGTGLVQDQSSLEVRWAGQFGESVSLTAGLHLFDQEYTYSERRLLLNILDRRGRSTIEHSTAGLFAQADINMTDDIVVTLGGRFTRETKDAAIGIIGDPNATGGCATIDLRQQPAGTSFDDLDAGVNMADCQQPFQDKETWSNFTPKIGLNWDINEDTIAYASFTRGFRSGGYNVRFTSFNPLASPGPYNEEVVDALEAGFKTTLFDNRLRVNGAVFRNAYDDLQRTVLDAAGTQATLNAATATVRGVELETVWLLSENLVVEAAAGWTDAAYDEFQHVENLTGKPASAFNFVMSPEFNSSIATTYSMDIDDLGSLDFRLSYAFVNDTFANDTNTAPLSQYELWDASVTFHDNAGNIRLSLFGRNLKDEVYYAFGTDFSTSSLAVKSNWLTPPRTYGVQFTYSF
ncbi:MAG: TonB-dependent receptor [Cellvibrionaceae bacterium]|nr:TonB-dependent receptor [Cellvibrionaceae bacterium]